MGLKVTYPRYFMIPSIGVTFQPNNMARGALDAVRGFQRSGWLPDIIDGHYLYPDGVAAAIIAKRLGVPLVLTARGTDVNVFGRLKKSAEKILLATQQAAAVISVSDRLKEALIEIGVEESKITVLRNGVDLEVFKPIPQKIARDRLGLGDGKFALCVGNLVPEKGFSLALESLRLLPEFRLLLVGDGPDLEGLKALARSLGLERRVTFMAPMPQSELCDVYSCADVLLLTSTREGWPNVLLESLACGTPVVSVDVGAAAQVLRGTEAGKVIDSRDAQVFASAIRVMARSPGLRDVAHRHAAQFDWASISRGQFEIFRRALK